MEKEYKDFYFCGKVISDKLSDSIYRISEWTEHGFSYELCGLGMLVLYNLGLAYSAKMKYCHAKGYYHCYVTFLNEDEEERILDPSWTSFPHIAKRDPYFGTIGDVKVHNSYSLINLMVFHRDYFVRLADCITRPETSYIFKELRCFRPDFNDLGLPVYNHLLDDAEAELTRSTGSRFQPFFHGRKPVSKEILEEFYNDDSLVEPSEKVCERARKAIILG